ncbi:PLP-dependent aminotransferase family protein [Oceanospirillum maris]|uniref:aminotransferase-like domain-containing protein n=1 Tax=Oceanospirillum maris TaxID=64977 RepID=UPI00041676C0|nr:PLP-dependent aminotransferase family protein [Oceanospirillum maris]
MTHNRNTIGSLSFSLQEQAGPFYQQLIDQILLGIKQQRLKPFDRLPSSRNLAQSLGTSRSTVVNAYDRLIAEGILTSQLKSGVFVAEQSAYILQSIKLAPVQLLDSQPIPQPEPPRETIYPLESEVSEILPEPLSFSSGIDGTVFPEQSWLKSMRSSWINPDPLVLEDGYPTGLPQLKQAVAEYLYQLRGLACKPQQILITAGSRDALTLLRRTFIKISPNSRWLAENPAYPPIHRLIESWQPLSSPSSSVSKISTTRSQPSIPPTYLLPLDQEGCCLPSALGTESSRPKAPPIVLLTPNRQYPTGIALSPQRRQQWLKHLQEEQCWLVEDDYDNEFSFNGKSGLPLMQADHSGRTFFVGSFSKVLFRGLRLGFIVAPDAYYSALEESRAELGSSAALPMQPVVAEFMKNGEFARHVNRMRRHYRQKRDFLLQQIERHLSQWFDWQVPQGGMHLLIRFKADVIEAIKDKMGLSLGSTLLDQQIAEDLMVKGIRLLPLSQHFADADYLTSALDQQGFILGFTAPTESSMATMVLALKHALIFK